MYGSSLENTRRILSELSETGSLEDRRIAVYFVFLFFDLKISNVKFQADNTEN